MIQALPLLIGFVIDLAVGDPPGLPHPVRAIGWLIKRLESLLRLRFPDSAPGRRKSGLVLAIVVPLTFFLLGSGVLLLAYRINFWLGFTIECLLSWQILATRCLQQESSKVQRALQADDLPGARQQLSWLVGRDTTQLTTAAVVRGTVETVAENTNDGVIAPLFYLALGGVPLALAYKAINTLDSMVGYKNDTYLDFGRASALLDDFANYIPARLAGLLMIVSTMLAGFPISRTWRIYLRDRRRHASPNSGQTESVCAGALGIQLGGNNVYFGKLVSKPTIGDALREPVGQDITQAQKMLFLTAVLGLLCFWPVRLASQQLGQVLSKGLSLLLAVIFSGG
jgi:adenosylcobinamide-phosphate synthase